jgi:aspartyl-tRNA(Asn)/glutamyl-tRNA(Gln) amidotransferase subunit A
VDRVNTLGRPGADPELEALFEAAVAELAAAGATIVDLAVPMFDELAEVTMLTWPAEAYAFQRDDLRTRWDDYGSATRMVMVLGALLGAGDLLRLDRVRQLGRQRVLSCFDDVDVIVTPTALRGCPPVVGTDFAAVVASVLTPAWNATGFPALSVPMGLGSESTPIGLQIVAPPFADALALRVGDAYQRRTDFHLAVPPLVVAA